MPLRHLLFNKRNGAPQRAPDQPRPDLADLQYFSLDHEVGQYKQQWCESHNYAAQPFNHGTEPQAVQQTTTYSHPYDQASMFSHNLMIPYQNHPYDFESHDLGAFSYSSDSCEVSSISQGSLHSSISSNMFDDDGVNSIHSGSSLSRKPSTISNYASNELCPALLAGGQGVCIPEQCGPNAPCLQYVRQPDDIEDCVPDQIREDSVMEDELDNQPIDFTPHTSPQRSQPQIQDMNTVPLDDDDKKGRVRARKSSTKLTSGTKDEPSTSKQTKKSRQRVAHSLVEKKYRENLNAKIMELYSTLKRAQHGIDQTDEADIDDMDDDRAPKKSEVLVLAMSWIQTAESDLRRKDAEIERLNERLKMMEGWMRSSGVTQRMVM
ncbi:hypothetical protein LTR05_000792 [Lithohypha guttulata]|uniref:BHLH domain-containing protein n=1 Tax=Lithohypha guttulata TaxID=1690604 RepID=A0AAN7YEA0_9EURO|nr:hypothetical protein LTR05_000792 [Lithohypha guttulata]